jgi:hypothetical protein
MSERGDFYEDDEPVDKVIAAFDAGEPVTTEAPSRGFNFRLGHDGPVESATTATPVTVHRRAGILERDLPRVHDWLSQVGAEAARKVSVAVRCVEDIRRLLAYEQHLIDTCTAEVCDCDTRKSLLDKVRALLPAVSETSERRAEPTGGGEGT